MCPAQRRDLRRHPDLEALARAAAEGVAGLAQTAVQERGRFTIALSGGKTPVALHRVLAGEFRDRIPWEKVEVLWGDERYVSPEDPRSNYRMAQETLLRHLPIPGPNIHPIPTLLPEVEHAAQAYEQTLRSHFPGRWPRFDLVLLGLGQDGHTASLFPHSPALEERARVVVAVRAEAEPPLRLTLTLPAINQAANIYFLVAGREKSEALRCALEGGGVTACPAAGVRLRQGNLVWWVDEGAASGL